jgi:hypothetical protein
LRNIPLLLFLLVQISCRSGPVYHEIPIPDRKLNLLGLEMIATHYLNEHPDDFHKFSRILTSADNALQSHTTLTRGAAMRWLKRAMKHEGFDEKMPVYLFLRSVYLKGWESSYLRWVDEGEREYLYDLMGAAMGGMHRCSTCTTGHVEEIK